VGHPLSDEVYDTLFIEGGLEALRIRNRFGEGNDSNLEPLASIVDAALSRLGYDPALFISAGSPPPSLKQNGSTVHTAFLSAQAALPPRSSKMAVCTVSTTLRLAPWPRQPRAISTTRRSPHIGEVR